MQLYTKKIVRETDIHKRGKNKVLDKRREQKYRQFDQHKCFRLCNFLSQLFDNDLRLLAVFLGRPFEIPKASTGVFATDVGPVLDEGVQTLNIFWSHSLGG